MQSVYWSVRESFVSFVLPNIPMIYPLVKGIIEKTRTLNRNRSNTSNINNYRRYHLGTLSRPRGVPYKHPLSLPTLLDETTCDSNRQIDSDQEHGPASNGDEASVGLPIQRPITPQSPNITVPFKVHNGCSNQSGSEPDPHILVTKEYTVADIGENANQPMGIA